MHGEFPEHEELYSSDERRHLAREAALVEAEGYGYWTRIREIAELAIRMEYATVALAHCPDMRREAELAARFLEARGLEILLPPPNPACDPQGMASDFTRRQADLLVVAGMCVGHEVILLRSSSIPATGLIARDHRLRHNPVAALYTSQSYYRKHLFFGLRRRERPPFGGTEVEAMTLAAEALYQETGEAEGGGGVQCRVAEAMEFAHALGVERIGLTFCVGLRKEALVLSQTLEGNGFQVVSACCKTGAVPKGKLGITRGEQVRPGKPEMLCNSIAQAELLNRFGVQLTFILGQCTGHDSATLEHLEAPALFLIVKDRVLAHNTVAALY
jgi:uncharacterized metal-binding protein